MPGNLQMRRPLSGINSANRRLLATSCHRTRRNCCPGQLIRCGDHWPYLGLPWLGANPGVDESLCLNPRNRPLARTSPGLDIDACAATATECIAAWGARLSADHRGRAIFRWGGGFVVIAHLRTGRCRRHDSNVAMYRRRARSMSGRGPSMGRYAQRSVSMTMPTTAVSSGLRRCFCRFRSCQSCRGAHMLII